MDDAWNGQPEDLTGEEQGTGTLEQAGGDAADFEPFLPTDYVQKGKKGKKKKKKRRSDSKKRALLLVAAGLLIILLTVGGTYIYNLRYNPSSFFGTPAPGATPAPTPVRADVNLAEATASPSPTPTPTLDPYDEMYVQADQSMLQSGNILNVLVIGVDYAEERETWDGKHDYHSDVMMVIAINFDENRVDLISIPRDTYAEIPGVKGIYKLNASINCGGGLDAEGGAGFLKTCQSVSNVLGGIPVDYYYAVTMPAVKGLVDAFGGVDYELEMSFSMAGRSYRAGQQHMDGQAVLDYLRVRKGIESSMTGDQNRVNRQKKMMVTLFKAMQKKNLILKIPDIVSSFEGQLYTNCTLNQTMALSLFAYKLAGDNIGMHSIGGTMTNIFGWNFVLTNQDKRVATIKEVYGVDAPIQYKYTAAYANYRWQSMLADQALATTKSLAGQVEAWLAADALLPTASPSATPEATPTPSLPTATDTPAPATPEPATPEPATPAPATPAPAPAYYAGLSARSGLGGSITRLGMRRAAEVALGQTQQYSEHERQCYQTYLIARSELQAALSDADSRAKSFAKGSSSTSKMNAATDVLRTELSHFKQAALTLADAFGYSSGNFNWDVIYWKDKSFNEVIVDFR